MVAKISPHPIILTLGHFSDDFSVHGEEKCSVSDILLSGNRPFPNYLWPLFQSESWCSSFHMKISFHLHVNEN